MRSHRVFESAKSRIWRVVFACEKKLRSKLASSDALKMGDGDIALITVLSDPAEASDDSHWRA